MATALRRRVHAGTELTNAYQTLLTFNVGLIEGGAIFLALSIVNLDTSSRLCKVHLIASGGSETDANCIFNQTLLPEETVVFSCQKFADSSAFIRAISDAATSNVGVMVTAYEEYSV